MQIRVKPGAGRTRVGGCYGDDTLVVAVQAPAVDGRATQAALKALAKALGCRAAEVTLVSGATSRTKLVEVPDGSADRFRELTAGWEGPGMTTVVSTLFVSFDSVAEVDPAWHFAYFDDAMAAAVTEDYADVDVLLLGRVTYDSFAGAWPGRETAGGVDAGYAKQLGDTRKVVATHDTGDLGWRNVEATPDVVARVAELRREPGVDKVLVAGSISIVRQLLAAGELDELRLLVHPVIAGAGRHLFDPAAGVQPLRLLSSESFPTGVLRLRYAPAELPQPAGYEDVVDKVPKGPE